MLVATLVLTLGWVLTLAPVGMSVPLRQPKDILLLFAPLPSALTYGFLGAYFFSLGDVLRRYVRGDLKPKVYSSIAVRVFLVFILAWVLDRMVPAEGGVASATVTQPGGVKLALIFLVGFFPETGLTYIREVARPLLGKLLSLSAEASPLTDLDGIDLYDRARLLDEGVTNVESLAHHDFIDLMMETRIPVARLVDWVDQAILYLHVSEAPSAKPGNHNSPELRTRLRKYGIRTATDLLEVYKAAKSRKELEVVLQALGDPSDAGKTSRMQLIVDALRDDEWLSCIQHWRQRIAVRAETHVVPAAA